MGDIKMKAFTVENIKEFMQLIFKGNLFDNYQVHDAAATTFTSFDISGNLNADFFDEGTAPDRKYCTWEEIRPFIFNVIKGSKLPKKMKIVLDAPNELKESVSPNISALFINISYENSILTITTGASLKTFVLDKSHEIFWDEYIENLIKENNIIVSTPAL